MCIEQFAEDDVCFRLACGHVFHRVRAASVHVAACCCFLGVRAVISAFRVYITVHSCWLSCSPLPSLNLRSRRVCRSA